MVYIQNGIVLSHKKEWNLAICNNMDGPRDYHDKWNKSDRERQILYDFTTCGIQKKKKWTNITKEKQSHRYREQTGGCQRGGGWDRLRGTNFQ